MLLDRADATKSRITARAQGERIINPLRPPRPPGALSSAPLWEVGAGLPLAAAVRLCVFASEKSLDKNQSKNYSPFASRVEPDFYPDFQGFYESERREA